MNIIFLLLLLFFKNSLQLYDYSKLLDLINKQTVKYALQFLPERKNVNLLKMLLEIKNNIIDFSLSEVESAFLIYNWISKSIEYDCTKTTGENSEEDAIKTYNSGRGTFLGISSLFNIMCNYINIKSDSIYGTIKIENDDGASDEILKITDNYIWNYIELNNTLYLIDVSLAGGFCYAGKFIPAFSDFYFGTNPEYFIRFHLPKDNKYQLLSRYITYKQFISTAFLKDNFFLFGFETISPDTQGINGISKAKINMTFNDTNWAREHYLVEGIQYSNGEIEFKDGLIVKYYRNGPGEITVEVTTDLLNENIAYYHLYDIKAQNSYAPIVVYKVLHYNN